MGSTLDVEGGYVIVVAGVADSLVGSSSSSFLSRISLIEVLGAQHLVPGFLHLNKSDISAFPEEKNVFFYNS